MRLPMRRIAALGASLALLSTLVACSSGSDLADTDTESSSAAAEETTTAAEETTPAEEEGTFAKDSGTLVFGVVPDTEAAENNWQPLADYIGKITGLNVETFQATDYNALIEAAIAGQIDVAAFSAFTYFNAVKGGAKITPFAGQVTGDDPTAAPGYYSVAITTPDSGIATLADFKGKNVCFVSETSTSGYLFPSKALIGAGVDPSTDVTPTFAGAHDASAAAVISGQCDAGFAEDAVADPLVADGSLVEVDRQLVPGAPLVVSSVLPQSVQDTIISNLSEITSDEIIEALGLDQAAGDNFKTWLIALSPVDDSYYDQIRDLCQALPSVEACAS